LPCSEDSIAESLGTGVNGIPEIKLDLLT
jgi:hypothetical protein